MPEWFTKKRFGYGWRPVTWQGWTVVLGGALLVLALVELRRHG